MVWETESKILTEGLQCRTKFDHRERPTVRGIHKFIAKVCETGWCTKTLACSYSVYTWTYRSCGWNCASKFLNINPNIVLQSWTFFISFSLTCLRWSLREDIGMMLYSIQLVPELKPPETARRCKFFTKKKNKQKPFHLKQNWLTWGSGVNLWSYTS